MRDAGGDLVACAQFHRAACDPRPRHRPGSARRSAPSCSIGSPAPLAAARARRPPAMSASRSMCWSVRSSISGASLDDHAVDVRRLARASGASSQTSTSPTANGALQSSQVEHDDIAAPARLEPPDRRGGADDPARRRPRRARRRSAGAQPRVLAARRARAAARARRAPPRTCRRRRRGPCRRARARRSRRPPRAGAAARRRPRGAGSTSSCARPSAPVRASRSMSESRSQTPWASALRSPSTPASASRSSSRPPAKASPQARCSRLSSACRWMPAPSSRGRRADRLDERVARPLRRHDRELGAQQRIAGELAHERPGSSSR